MSWTSIIMILSAVVFNNAINRPVYKIALTQKGFAQFLQYDLETPPLREFTFCTWLRVFELHREQTIFAYIVNGNNRIMRVWLEANGRQMGVTINNKRLSRVPVDLTKDTWRHLCLSYQSDYGAWALYMDSRLITCEASQALYGFVIPGGGSVIVGYGIAEDGTPSGMEGEVFGANMILASTIEKNYTIKSYPEFAQKSFTQNKLKHDADQGYIVLSDLMSEEAKKPKKEVRSKVEPSEPTFRHTSVDHEIGLHFGSKQTKLVDSSHEKEILDLTTDEPFGKKNAINFWNLVNNDERKPKFQTPNNFYQYEQTSSHTNDLPSISEYETPPPSKPTKLQTIPYSEKYLDLETPPVTESIYKLNSETSRQPHKTLPSPASNEEISEIELPPSPNVDKNVYGQWTSSKYAGSVLNYLKSIKFHFREKKVPQTIPLQKMSDHFPYASETRVNVVRPPLQMQRKNLIVEKRYPTHYFHPQGQRNVRIVKRHAIYPEINLKITKNDARDEILFAHSQTNPKNVEITHRSQPHISINDIFKNMDNNATNIQSKLFNYSEPRGFELYSRNSLLTVLPFLKSIEYFTEDNLDVDSDKRLDSNDIYSKSLTTGRWHNVMAYNKEQTPRNMNIRQNHGNKKHVNIPLKYKPETNKLVHKDDPSIVKGRVLAMEVSNHSNSKTDSISILKYNHGWLPGHEKKIKNKNQSKVKRRLRTLNHKNNFDKHIKIGNALNERDIIGTDDDQKKQSFEGGNAKIPDIQKYRSDIDDISEIEHDYIPSSLRPRICNNVELYDHILYVQPDGSIDMTHILSPLKTKNVGIQFVLLNYKSCSLENSGFEENHLLLINWSRTPVRLFGGAHARKTKDLCGFF